MWAAGSKLFNTIIEALNDSDVEEDTRKQIYEVLIPEFEELGCDTLQECIGEDKAFNEAYKSVYPEDEEEDESEEE